MLCASAYRINNHGGLPWPKMPGPISCPSPALVTISQNPKCTLCSDNSKEIKTHTQLMTRHCSNVTFNSKAKKTKTICIMCTRRNKNKIEHKKIKTYIFTRWSAVTISLVRPIPLYFYY